MNNTTTSQKIGWVIFAIGALYMFGLGWLRSWWVVSAANQVGPHAYFSLLGFIWAWSVPLGAFIVAFGAALTAKVERRIQWLLILLLLPFLAWRFIGTTNQMIPMLFGVGGGLITLFFLGSTWQWAKTRPSITKAGKIGSDLRMVGLIFFVVSAWDLCGIFGIANFVLRPELAGKFSVPTSSTINSASGVIVLLVLGWAFTFLGQLISRQSSAASLS